MTEDYSETASVPVSSKATRKQLSLSAGLSKPQSFMEDRVMPASKSTETIPPFPEHIERDAFGHYICGLTDGEGCFILDVQNRKNDWMSGGARFRILIREDDYGVISLIRSYWQCGQIYFKKRLKNSNWSPIIIYNVGDLSLLNDIIVPHFEKYRLHAKKKRDFDIWSQAVRLLYEIKFRPLIARHVNGKIKGTAPKWSDEDRAEYLKMVSSLRDGRQYTPQRDLF
jgi:hypothetical protein